MPNSRSKFPFFQLDFCTYVSWYAHISTHRKQTTTKTQLTAKRVWKGCFGNYDDLFLSTWHSLESSGKRVEMRNCLVQVGLWTCLWRMIMTEDWYKKSSRYRGRHHSLGWALGCIALRKTSKQTARTHSFLSAVSYDYDVTGCSNSCLGFPSVINCNLRLLAK